MSVFNHAGGEINIKIVYYGPGLSGKTTNLELIYSKMPRDSKGKMVSMKTRTDRTLFFDFLPIDVGEINGMKVRYLLYTVPGQVYYNATRKLVLKGVDAVVLVADSDPERLADNRESLDNLEENLNDLGLTLDELPWVIQYNKRDLSEAMDVSEMHKELNTRNVPAFEAIATTGEGVYETFESIAGMVFRKIQENFGQQAKKAKEASKQGGKQSISVEVVAQGSMRQQNSEADKSESFNNAEMKEEEHESVSEFVDSVLKEKADRDESIDLGATRGGYEDYGHLVELNDEEEIPAEAGSKTAAPGMEIISDPLEELNGKPRADKKEEDTRQAQTDTVNVQEKTIRVPVTLSEEEIGKEIPVKVILEIKIGSE